MSETLDVGSDVTIVPVHEEGYVYIREDLLDAVMSSSIPDLSKRAFLYIIGGIDNEGYAKILPKRFAKDLKIGRKHVLDPFQPLIDMGLLKDCGKSDVYQVYQLNLNFPFSF